MTHHARLIVGALILCASGDAGRGQSAEDRFTSRMTDLLDPTTRLELYRFASGPQPRTASRVPEHPEVPLARAEVVPPRVPGPGAREPRPRVSPEPPPLRHYLVAAQVPQTPRLPAGTLAKQPSVDVQVPPPLPILGTHVRDRVSLADPSLEVSVQSTLTPQLPARTSEVAFTPWNLPDPFEHAQTVRLRQAWPESKELPAFIIPPTRR